jgi:hypothetical protein
MDAIETLDWGAYAHFTQKAAEQPGILPFMEIGYYLSDYLAIGVYFSLAALLFALQGRHRSAQVTALSLAVAVALIYAIRALVPRMRPPAAQGWLGVTEMQGSYPSAAVFLFLLALIVLGLALAGLLRFQWQRAGYCVVAAALFAWVFFSQFYLALAFLTDMLGGMAGAAMVGMLAYQAMDWAPGSKSAPLTKTPP